MRSSNRITTVLAFSLVAGWGSQAFAAPPEEEPADADTADADAADAADADAADADGGDAAADADATDADADADADADTDPPSSSETDTASDEVAPEGPAEASDATDAEGADEKKCDCPVEEPAPEPDPTHITDLTISAGGLLTTGNANTLAATGKLATLVRRGIHQFTGNIDGNYGMNREDRDAEWIPTTTNVEAKTRYDVYFKPWGTAFIMSTERHDPFQGLNIRWTLDPGVTFYAVQKDAHSLKFDVGYQLQVDNRRNGAILLFDDDGIILDANGNATRDPELDKVFVNHSGRLAGNYEFKFNDMVKWRLGLEYVQSFLFKEEADRWRLNGDTGLDVSLIAGLGLGLNFQIRYDNKPLPDVEKLDTFSNVTLTYTFKGPTK